MDPNYLKHFGVVGMKWGVRRMNRSSAIASRTHKANVRNLKSERKKAKLDAWDRDEKEFNKKYKTSLKNVNTLEKARLREVKATTKPGLMRILKRSLATADTRAKRDQIIPQLEKYFIDKESTRKKNLRKTMDDFVISQSKKFDLEYNKSVKGKPLTEWLTAARDLDKKISRETVEGLLELEIQSYNES